MSLLPAGGEKVRMRGLGMKPQWSGQSPGPSPQRQAFPRISKLFLGRFEENQGVVGQSPRKRVVSSFFASSRPRRGPGIGCRTRPQLKITRIQMIEKELSPAISGKGLRASAMAHAPTRKPTAATAAARNFDGGRLRSRKSGVDCGVDEIRSPVPVTLPSTDRELHL